MVNNSLEWGRWTQPDAGYKELPSGMCYYELHRTDEGLGFREVQWLIQGHTACLWIWKIRSLCFQNSLSSLGIDLLLSNFLVNFSNMLPLLSLPCLYSGWTTVWQIAYLIRASEIEKYMVIFTGGVEVRPRERNGTPSLIKLTRSATLILLFLSFLLGWFYTSCARQLNNDYFAKYYMSFDKTNPRGIKISNFYSAEIILRLVCVPYYTTQLSQYADRYNK